MSHFWDTHHSFRRRHYAPDTGCALFQGPRVSCWLVTGHRLPLCGEAPHDGDEETGSGRTCLRPPGWSGGVAGRAAMRAREPDEEPCPSLKACVSSPPRAAGAEAGRRSCGGWPYVRIVARRVGGRAVPRRAGWHLCSPGLHPRWVHGRRTCGGGGDFGRDGGRQSRRAGRAGILHAEGFCVDQEGPAPFRRKQHGASNQPRVGGGPRLDRSLGLGLALGGGGCGWRWLWAAAAGVVAGVGDGGILARLP